MSRRIRIAIPIILALAAGGAGSILAASCALARHQYALPARWSPVPPPRWAIEYLGEQVEASESFESRHVRTTTCIRIGADGTTHVIGEHQAGWPLLAWSGRWTRAYEPLPPNILDLRDCVMPEPDQGALQLPVGYNAPRWLPRALLLTPVWPGFLINSLLYAAALWGVAVGGRRGFVALQSRRQRYQSSGMCAKCGYARGALPVCPECGEA